MLIFLLSILLGAIAIAAALHALLTKSDSKSALAWVSFCLFVPLVGPTIYVLFGINRFESKARTSYLAKAEEDTTESLSEPEGTNFRPMSLVGEKVTGWGLRSCDEFEVLVNGEALYPSMLASIRNAKDSVYCATYIFHNDVTGQQFIEAFCSAQDRGVDVRIIIDGLGSVAYRPSIHKSLVRSGLNYKRFSPIRLFPPSLRINMRNHRKILVVDSNVAFTGGQNIGDRHLVDDPNNPIPTRDIHFRFTGKIVDGIERTFLKDWNHCAGVTRTTAFKPKNTNRDQSDTWTRVIPDGPNEDLDKLNSVMIGVFSAAKKRIWLMTPYFLPGPDVVGALQGAQLRGVDVKILLPERTNIHMAHYAAQHNIQYILGKGLNVYLQPSPFIHTKAILIDDDYCLIGSANMDPRSLRLNFELGVEVFSTAFNKQLSDYFKVLLDKCMLLDKTALKERPRWAKVRDAMAWLFSPYL